jgi:hypothetical protein
MLLDVGRIGRSSIAAASIALAFACGGQTNALSAPSPATPGAQQPAIPNAATISGTVVGLSASTQLKAQRLNLAVSVTGTSVTTRVDDQGRFTLANVPAGHVDLHFTGPGVDAHLAIDVAERSMLVIVVRVNGNDAHLEDDRGGANPGLPDQTELAGTIDAGSVSGSCDAHNLAFTIASTRVRTSAVTVFRDGSCGILKAGTRVEVKGVRESDGSIAAASIEVEDAAEPDEDDDDDPGGAEVEIRGTIAAGSVAGSCASNSLSFTVNATIVRTSASTEFRNASCTSLSAGDGVEVKGGRQSDGSVLASRVERKR